MSNTQMNQDNTSILEAGYTPLEGDTQREEPNPFEKADTNPFEHMESNPFEALDSNPVEDTDLTPSEDSDINPFERMELPKPHDDKVPEETASGIRDDTASEAVISPETDVQDNIAPSITPTESTPPEDQTTDMVQSAPLKLIPVGGFKDKFIQNRNRVRGTMSTGLKALDIALQGGLMNDLYIMGAETSTGKSALMMFMAMSLVLQGAYVLYFALEMSADEIIARGISSISYTKWKAVKSSKRYTVSDILYSKYDEETDTFYKIPYTAYEEHAEEYFRQYNNRLIIVENKISGVNAAEISQTVEAFHNSHKDSPVVVFIDYLQNIVADPNRRAQADRKTKVDESISSLKALASNLKIPVFAASSLGRSSYGAGKSSNLGFKESGDIEYTGGINIGWNWHGVTDISASSSSKKKEAEARIREEEERCKQRGYRKMEFCLTKFRNAERDNVVRLLFYPGYSYFVDEYGFNPDNNGDNPFDDWDQYITED